MYGKQDSAGQSVAAGIRAAAVMRMDQDPGSADRLADFLQVERSSITGLRKANSWELPLALKVADGLELHLQVKAL
jgi:hypothetical protein